jgi:hypothetical protein
MVRWALLVPFALLLAVPARAVVSAQCELFGSGATYTALQNWPFDTVRVQVPWRPFCVLGACPNPPAVIGANVRVTGTTIDVDMYGSDESLPPSVLVTRPVPQHPTDPVIFDVGPLATGTYTIQASAYGVTEGVVTNLCGEPRPFMTVTIEKATGPVARQTAVEFYDVARDHYFVSSDPAEIAALDSGTHPGWARTGKSFGVFAPGKSGGVGAPVCRFYGSPAAGLDSHFYTANAAECAALPGLFGGSWTLETSEAFDVRLPNAEAQCEGGFSPVYRFWNRRTDSNHRYTTDPSVAAQMRNRGWAEEVVSMCSPP